LVGWHGSSCWLLCLCVLCFVFCAASKTINIFFRLYVSTAASKTIRCSRVSLYYLIFQKHENYELCISSSFFVDQITTGKITTRKKRYSHLAVGWNKSQITVCSVKIQTPTITRKITTQNKKRYSCLATGWNKSQITICRVKIRTPTMTRKTYDLKKKVQSFATHVTF
jgi:hypothetical protein